MVKNKTVFFFSWWKLRCLLFSHNFSLTTLHTIININISKESYYCKVSTPSWRLVWVRTDAWYFLLKAVWLYQLKCWSGDFSLGEGSRDQQYPRYLCNITSDMCLSLHHLHTDLSLPSTWAILQTWYWSCWARAGLVQNCDARRYYYFMILKDQCWVISSMIYGDCCQIC